MKRFYILFLCVFGLLISLAPSGAQDVATAAPQIALPPPGVVQPYFDALSGKFGWLLTAVTIIGSLRILFKPIFAVAHNIADATTTTKDNEILDKVEQSKVTKAVCFALDWVGSIKVKRP